MRHMPSALSRSRRGMLQWLAASAWATVLLPPWPSPAQTAPEAHRDARTRQLWNDAFKKKRAEAQARPSSPRPAPRPAPAAKPRPSPPPAVDPLETLGDSLVGITLWRLRWGPGEGVDRALVFLEGTQSLVRVPLRIPQGPVP